VSQASLTQGGVHVGRGEGKSFWLLTDLHTFKVVGDDTNGAFTVAELTAGSELGRLTSIATATRVSTFSRARSTSRWPARRLRLAPERSFIFQRAWFIRIALAEALRRELL